MNRKGLLFLFVAVGLSATAWFVFSSRGSKPVPVIVEPVKSGVLSASFTADGVVKSVSVDLSPESPGRVISLHAREGDKVQKGQLLAEVDDEQVHAQERQAMAVVNEASESLRQARTASILANDRAIQAERTAQANVRAAKAKLAHVKKGARKEEVEQAEHRLAEIAAQKEEAEKAYERAHELFTQGAVSRSDFEKAEARMKSVQQSYEAAVDALALLKAGSTKEEVDIAQAEVEAAESALESAKTLRTEASLRRSDVQIAASRLKEAQEALSSVRAIKTKSQVFAPFSGVISKRIAELGQVATPGVAMFTLQDPNSVYVEAEVSSEDSSKITPGMIVKVSQPGLPGRTFDGKVTLVAPAAEIKPDAAVRTRILRARIMLISGNDLFRPGMEVDVEGRKEIAKKVLLIHADALVLEARTSSVYVVADGVATLKPIKTGFSSEGKIEVLDGLVEGDKIVVEGKDKLSNGAAVIATEK